MLCTTHSSESPNENIKYFSILWNYFLIKSKWPLKFSYFLLIIESWNIRSSHPQVFLKKAVPKTCSKFTGEYPCRSAISIKLLCNFIEIALRLIETALRHGCSPLNLLHILRRPFPGNTSGWLLLQNPIQQLLDKSVLSDSGGYVIQKFIYSFFLLIKL